MYFTTDEAWEVKDPTVRAWQGGESRLFPCVELMLNQPLWHLDLLVCLENGSSFWRRFVLTSLEQAVATAAAYPGSSRLHYQNALLHDDGGSYGIWPVQRVLAGRCPSGRPAHLIELPHAHEVYPDRRLPASGLLESYCVFEASCSPPQG